MKQTKFWQKYEPILRELVKEGLTDRQIAASGKIPGKSYTAIATARFRYGIESGEKYRRKHHGDPATLTRVVNETPERTVFAPVETEKESFDDLWDRAVKRTSREVAKIRHDGIARVQIMTDKPVAISISSDWHVSTSTACDLPGLRSYLETIRDTPGAFGLFVGDAADNNIKWSKQMHDIPDEWRLVAGLLGIVGLKMLGVTSGNHDDWSRATAGIDMLKFLTQRERLHFASDELYYIVELVDPASHKVTARYGIYTRHKFRRNSTINWTHACYRLLEERIGEWPEMEDGGTLVPDVVAIGDNHLAAVEGRTYRNKTVWAARMGPWQAGSSFGRALGFPSCPPTAPSFVLYPHKAQPIKGFADYQSALDVLRQERAEWSDVA